MEEAELAKREDEKRERGNNEWEQWQKENQLKLTEPIVPEEFGQFVYGIGKQKRLRDASTSESDAEMVKRIKKLLRTAETKRKRNHCMDSINKTQANRKHWHKTEQMD
ncbi:hypothetical protein niasHT_031478 [Heterodera trifolii]